MFAGEIALLRRGRVAASSSPLAVTMLLGARLSLLRRAALAAAGSAAASAALSSSPTAAAQASGGDAWADGALQTRTRLRAELLAAGCSEGEAHAALTRVKLAVKGERLCASLALPRDALPALVPLLRSFPLITWKPDADSGAGGLTLVLCDTK